jgi:hypothetical protein
MGKLPAFMFYPGDWQKDPCLRRCSKAAKSVWMDNANQTINSHEAEGMRKGLSSTRRLLAGVKRPTCVCLG